MDVAMHGINSNETWIHNSTPPVPAVIVGIILLAVATFLLQLSLVLAVMYRCWRKDRKICQTDFSKGKVLAAENILAGQLRGRSGSVVTVPLYPDAPYVMPCYHEEPAAFPPWDLVQSA